MPTSKSTNINSAEAAAAFDANRFFGHTPEQRWYATRASKRAAQTSAQATEQNLALSNVYQQYPVEEVVQPIERRLSEEEIREVTARVMQTGQLLVWFRSEETGDAY